MLPLSRLATICVVTLALAWFLPDLFRRAAAPERVRVSAYYSALSGQFQIRTDGFDKSSFRDEDGNNLSAEDHRRLLPFLYFADLAKHGQFPGEIAGHPVSPEMAKREMQVLQLNPRDWNAPAINLHTLFESSPWGTRLSLPDDMFRVEPSGLSFIRGADGTVLEEKSRRFTQAMTAAGVTWPLAAIGGNPSPLKDFDEGYLLVDATARMFHLKMVRGEPFCRDTGLTVPGNVRSIVVDEHPRREFLGAIVTDASVLLFTYAGTLIRLPLEGFDADGSAALLRSDPLNRTLAATDLRDRLRTPMRLAATGTDYQPLHRYDLMLPAAYRAHAARVQDVASLLFPFSLVQFTPETGRVTLRFTPAANPLLALLGTSMAAVLLWLLRRRHDSRPDLVEMIFTLLTGMPGLVALTLFGPCRQTNSS